MHTTHDILTACQKVFAEIKRREAAEKELDHLKATVGTHQVGLRIGLRGLGGHLSGSLQGLLPRWNAYPYQLPTCGLVSGRLDSAKH